MITRAAPLIRVKPEELAAAGVQRVPRVDRRARRAGRCSTTGASLDVANVIWCTGFHAGFSWIDLPIFDATKASRSTRRRGHEAPGLYFVGLHFLYAMSSSMIHGVGRDAERIVDALAARSSLSSRATLRRWRRQESGRDRARARRLSAAGVGGSPSLLRRRRRKGAAGRAGISSCYALSAALTGRDDDHMALMDRLYQRLHRRRRANPRRAVGVMAGVPPGLDAGNGTLGRMARARASGSSRRTNCVEKGYLQLPGSPPAVASRRPGRGARRGGRGAAAFGDRFGDADLSAFARCFRRTRAAPPGAGRRNRHRAAGRGNGRSNRGRAEARC